MNNFGQNFIWNSAESVSELTKFSIGTVKLVAKWLNYTKIDQFWSEFHPHFSEIGHWINQISNWLSKVGHQMTKPNGNWPKLAINHHQIKVDSIEQPTQKPTWKLADWLDQILTYFQEDWFKIDKLKLQFQSSPPQISRNFEPIWMRPPTSIESETDQKLVPMCSQFQPNFNESIARNWRNSSLRFRLGRRRWRRRKHSKKREEWSREEEEEE